MQRSGKVVVVSHCLLNANAKVKPLALYPGVLCAALNSFIQNGFGLIQLPCPETSYLGINRWGMSKEQYDHPNFRQHCRNILIHTVNQIEALSVSGCEITCVIGVDGSPSCGVNLTSSGLTGGVIKTFEDIEPQIKKSGSVKGSGVFMEELKAMLQKRNISLPFKAVDEHHPENLID
ncbi:MAG: DUF523 domain-containing protein [Desulfamplus sp.]|nr:DUF523 domain-containing protein [Desulfamplus sp.]